MHKRPPRLDLRRGPRTPQSRFAEFETEELEYMLSKFDQKDSLTALGLAFEILRELRDRPAPPNNEQELPDGVKPS